MPRPMKNLMVLVIALAAACGGKAEQTTTPTDTTATATHADHHDGLTPELAKVNDVMTAVWHAPAGEQRMTDGCAAVSQLNLNIDELVAAPAPANVDAAAWTAGTTELQSAGQMVLGQCDVKDATAFDRELTRTHEALHALIGLAHGHHEADGTHEHTHN